MGPFNRVTDYKISDADEVYRQHDIGYAKELARGRSPYTRWNKYDQALMDSPALGWPDYLAKGAFGLKKILTYGMPEVKGTQLKDVKSVSSSVPLPKDGSRPGKGIKDYMKNPTIPKGGFTEVLPVDDGQITGVESGPRNFWRNRDFGTSVPSGGSGGGKFQSRIRYEKY